MRTLVFFDLPTETAEDRRHYRQFRKLLINNGFLMMQESVYCRMLINQNAAQAVTELLRRNKPPSGFVQVLTITEKQFTHMETITGEFKTDVIHTDERLIEI